MSGSYVFEETFDRRIYQWCHLQTSVWRKNLSAAEYVKRERHLAETRVCDVNRDPDQEHGIHYWVFRDTSIEKDESLSSEIYDLTYNIVASCETLHRKSWKFIIDEDEVRRVDVISPCIGAVHTLEQHRKKGIASRMIKALDVKLKEMLSEDNFVTLYSEVGEYYDQFGYKRFEVPLFRIPVPKEKPHLHKGITYSKFETFEDLITIYHGKFLKNIYHQMGKDEAKRNRIALVPTIDIVEWHHARSNFISNVVYGEDPGHFGAQLKDEEGNVTGFIIFSHDYTEKALYLFMVYAVDFESLKILLDAVHHEAIELGYEAICGWESDLWEYKVLQDDDDDEQAKADKQLKDFVVSECKGEVGLKNGSISAVKMLDGDNNVVWHGNGKFAWF